MIDHGTDDDVAGVADCGPEVDVGMKLLSSSLFRIQARVNHQVTRSGGAQSKMLLN